MVRLPASLVVRADEIRGHDGSPYMERWFVVESKSLTVRYHHLLASDSDRDLHDHPWDFVSLILEGSYVEETPAGEQRFSAGDVVVHRANDLHRLQLLDGPVWTYVSTGPFVKTWGFQTPSGWVPWREYERAGSSQRAGSCRQW